MKKIIIKLGHIFKYPSVLLLVAVSIFKGELAKSNLLYPAGYLLLILGIILGLGVIFENQVKRKNEK